MYCTLSWPTWRSAQCKNVSGRRSTPGLIGRCHTTKGIFKIATMWAGCFSGCLMLIKYFKSAVSVGFGRQWEWLIRLPSQRGCSTTTTQSWSLKKSGKEDLLTLVCPFVVAFFPCCEYAVNVEEDQTSTVPQFGHKEGISERYNSTTATSKQTLNVPSCR